eukprot:2735224-Rhodomonas_salina.5
MPKVLAGNVYGHTGIEQTWWTALAAVLIRMKDVSLENFTLATLLSPMPEEPGRRAIERGHLRFSRVVRFIANKTILQKRIA